MLIDFTVKNYRSFKESSRLSTVTTRKQKTPDNIVISTGINSTPTVEPVTALFGANGAGKSNLLRAMDFMRWFVGASTTDKKVDELIPVAPFLLSSLFINQPSEFEVTFVTEGYLFQYGFIVSNKYVEEEWLYATPLNSEKQKSQTWIERTERNASTATVKSELKSKDIWKKSTRDDALILSTAVQLNSKKMLVPFNWIRRNLRVLDAPETLSGRITSKKIMEKEKDKIENLLKHLGVQFMNIEVKENKYKAEQIAKMGEVLNPEVLKMLRDDVYYEVSFTHLNSDNEICKLDLDDESKGTKLLYALAGPLIETLENGYTLTIDEIQASVHPLAIRKLVSLFLNSEINKNSAQLIFSTHDISILNFLEREQIWLIDKSHGFSEITALSEFKKVPNEDIENRYMSGRYGAVPNIFSDL